MKKAIICKGLPGSGKSTWARDFCEKHPDYVRICRDDLRNMRGKYWLPKQEDMITAFVTSLVRDACDNDMNIVLDETNLNVERAMKLQVFLSDLGYHVSEKSFLDVPVEDCIKNDIKRPNSVGAKVIWDMYYKYVHVPNPVAEITGLPPAVICDLDGTLAIHNGRSPYDYSRVNEDLLNDAVHAIIHDRRLMGDIIILLSGRDGSCYEDTMQWLADNDVRFNVLLMRAAGDTRKDHIVKKELFDRHIRFKYNIRFVLDDRDRVVRMWRKDLGLKCLQVNYGDF